MSDISRRGLLKRAVGILAGLAVGTAIPARAALRQATPTTAPVPPPPTPISAPAYVHATYSTGIVIEKSCLTLPVGRQFVDLLDPQLTEIFQKAYTDHRGIRYGDNLSM